MTISTLLLAMFNLYFGMVDSLIGMVDSLILINIFGQYSKQYGSGSFTYYTIT